MADSENDEDFLSDHIPLVYDSQPNAQVDLCASTGLRSEDDFEDQAAGSASQLSNPGARLEDIDGSDQGQGPTNRRKDTAKSISERPNKFHGPASTWRAWTESERLLASSLTQLRNQDLALHLYAAHHLKRQLRAPALVRGAQEWHHKGRWQDSGKAANGNGFDPGKRWTAWPLPPDTVPREWERWGKPLDEVESSAKRLADVSSRALLEDIIMGSTIKLAKDRFKARPWEPEEETESPRHNIKTEPGQSPESKAKGLPLGYKLKPVILADDEEAYDILRPSIQHVFTQLDSILLGLHYSRATYTTSKPMSSQSRSRSRSASSSRSRPRPEAPTKPKDTLLQVPSTFESTTPRPARPPGRPRKRPRPLEGESYHQIRKPVLASQASTSKNESTLPNHALNNRPQSTSELPSPSSSSSPPSPPSTRNPRPQSPSPRPSSRPSTRTRLRSRNRKHLEEREARLHARDWSEVLATAAHTGVKHDILLRAADRCSRLFGEGILFRRLRMCGDGEGEGNEHGQEEDEEEDEGEVYVGEDPGWARTRGGSGSRSGDEEEDKNGAEDEQDEDEEEEEQQQQQRGRPMLRGRATLRPEEQTLGGIRKDGFMEPVPHLKMKRGPDIKPRKLRGRKGTSTITSMITSTSNREGGEDSRMAVD